MPFDNIRRIGPGSGGSGERAINLPPVILWLIVINVAVQAIRETLSEALDQQLVFELGLMPVTYTGEPGGTLLSMLVSPFTYQFLHGGWMHLGINMLTLAAFGAPVERILGPRRFVAFYLSAGVMAGLVHIVFYATSTDAVVGASGAISGVFGAVLMLLRSTGNLSSLFPVAGIWIALNVFFGLFGGTPGAGSEPVAWVAHIGGFVYGLIAIRFFVPRHME